MTALLVVDDNEQNRYMLQMLLTGHGYTVVLASDGTEALEKARQNPPDLIITDILMPRMDGYTLCREWKRSGQLKDIPLVFYTGTYTDPRDEELALNMGAERFILKPQEPEVLLELVEEVIATHRAEGARPILEPPLEETVYFKEYNQALIRKLEEKLTELESANTHLEREIAERKQTESRERLARGVLELLNQPRYATETIGDILRIIKKEMDFEAAAIRLRAGEDFPYYVADGFAESFLCAKRHLYACDEGGAILRDATGCPVFDCICGSVLRGPTEATAPFLTVNGSFWSNDSTQRQAMAAVVAAYGRIHDDCRTEAYESLALIPLRSGDAIIGLLQLSDRRSNRFSPERISFLESLGASIGIALARNQAEVALRESEQKLAEAQKMVQLGHWNWDVKTGEVQWSPEVYGIFQRDPNTFTPHIDSILALSPWPEDRQRDTELIQRAMEHHEKGVYEQRFLRPDGSTGYYTSTFRGVYDDEGVLVSIVGTVQDITERRQAEEALRVSHERLRRFVDANIIGIVISSAAGRVIEANDYYLNLIGITRQEFEAREVDWRAITPPEWYPVDEKALDEVGVSGTCAPYEKEYLRRDGTRVAVLLASTLLPGPEGDTAAFVMDLTERKRAEAALALHTRRVQALLDLQLLSHTEEDQILDFVLTACLNMTQSAYAFVGTLDDTESLMSLRRWSKETVAQCACSTTPAEYPIDTAGWWADCVRRREPIICNDYRVPHPSKKGLPAGHVPIDRFVALPVLDGPHVVAVAAVANKSCDYNEADVNALSTLLHKMWGIISRQRAEHEREILEEQYRQAQKMEAIGQLAGGVAHDFNNILQAIVGYSSMLLDILPKQDETHEFAEEIAEGADRAATLTRQLLAFSRRQILEMEDLDLNDVVSGMMKMIRRIIGEDIEISITEGHPLCAIHADRGQMEQVLLNLCVNARDAMPEGGTLSIATGNVVIDDNYREAHAWASPGRYILLTVTDTGCGIDVQTQARIFEPFFTTKEVGKGTGLGLATVYGIVRQHQGMIQVYSEIGQGTTFKVYLPSFGHVVSPIHTESATRPRGGTETILVAEDDDTIRTLASRILKNAGYTVLLAADGEETLNVIKAHTEDIDLVLLDLVMPKMNGRAVYAALQPPPPRLRFVFSSGYSANAAHTDFVQREGIALLQKPYGPDALLAKIREVLDAAPKDSPAERSDAPVDSQ